MHQILIGDKMDDDILNVVCDHILPPMIRYLRNSHPDIRGSLGERGGFCIISMSGGLKLSAVAGKPSVTKLTHSNWTGINASGMPRAAVRKILDRN